MAQPRITIVINGKTYSLCADNAEAIGNVPLEDRLHLITLLDVVRSRTDTTREAPRDLRDNPSAAPTKPAVAGTASPIDARQPTPVSMGAGDVDALIARLAAEEKQSRKPGITRAGLYKVTGGFLLFIFLLVLLL